MFGLSEDSLRNATDWLARISGTSAGQARAVLNTAAALEGLPAGRCWDCHEKKTEADRRAGLLGGKGLVKPSRGKREPP